MKKLALAIAAVALPALAETYYTMSFECPNVWTGSVASASSQSKTAAPGQLVAYCVSTWPSPGTNVGFKVEAVTGYGLSTDGNRFLVEAQTNDFRFSAVTNGQFVAMDRVKVSAWGAAVTGKTVRVMLLFK